MVSVTTVVSLAVRVAVTVQGLVIVDVLQVVVLVIVLQTVLLRDLVSYIS